jgi:arabinogalactan oligomer/maltooligosaccharide transport system permease protein
MASNTKSMERESAARTGTTTASPLKKPSTLWADIGAQVALLVLTLIVLFPVLWILGMALDPRDLSRPTSIIPPGASLEPFRRIFTQPFANGVTVWAALWNSILVSGGTSIVAAVLGTTAAYAFSRFRFPGRQAGMLSFIVVQMMPAGATLAPLIVILSLLRWPKIDFLFLHLNAESLRTTLPGLAIAYASGALPFVIWNLKGYFDTIPKDLEEAAVIDGATNWQSFTRVILPLSLPAFAVTLLFSFMAGWSEFLMAWTFLSDPGRFTLPMVLAGMVGQYSANTRWADFAALSIVMSLPIVVLFFLLQKWIVGGLTLGGVKG